MNELEMNQALLAGEVFGALSFHFKDLKLETNEDGDYTGRTLIMRPSGWWVVTVAPLEEET